MLLLLLLGIFIILPASDSDVFPSILSNPENSTISSPSSVPNLMEFDSTLLKNLLNISNSPPELLLEYYDLDDDLLASTQATTLDDSEKLSEKSDKHSKSNLPDIYPDPEEINHKIKIININHITQHKNIDTIRDLTFDNDLKGHDFIDNIMYIYYGHQNDTRKGIGSSIVIGGQIIALAAQILCLILMLLRNRQNNRNRRQNALFSIFFNFVANLFLSNLIFILGIHSTKSMFVCSIIAILLHYIYLSTAIWGLIYIYIIYDYIANDCGINLKYNYFMAYGAPAIYVLFSCAISSTSYETIQYCWMSVQRGMIVNFMIPISGIIISSTILGTLCLREIRLKQREVIAESIENILENAARCHEINENSVIETDKCCEYDERESFSSHKKNNDFYDSKFDLGVLSIVDLSLQSSQSNEIQDFTDFKVSIKFWLFFQPVFAISWFFGTIAMENRHSAIMPIIFILSYNIMSWYLLIKSPNICPLIPNQSQKEKLQEKQQHNFDTIPLLCTPNNANNQLTQNMLNKISSIEDDININWASESLADVSLNNLDSISTISN